MAALFFRLLRRPNRPIMPRPPAKSHRAPGSGVAVSKFGSKNGFASVVVTGVQPLPAQATEEFQVTPNSVV